MEMAGVTGLWWQPCADGARVLRVLGPSPCVALPAVLGERPVTELGAYCFADRALALPADAVLWGEDGHAVTGRFVEEVTLPAALHTLHSAAFYDCRGLRRLALGPGLRALGSDLFTNCRALQTLTLAAHPAAPTGLQRLLGALNRDLTVEFAPAGTTLARLFYPDYLDLMDENAPAHLFNHNIEGEGYRYRQCFLNGAVDFAAYDAVFAQATVGEPAAKLCPLALGRLLYPHALAPTAQAQYEQYLRLHSDAALATAVAVRDVAALRRLCTLGVPAAQAAAVCAGAGWSAGAGAVYSAGMLGQGAAKRYDF